MKREKEGGRRKVVDGEVMKRKRLREGRKGKGDWVGGGRGLEGLFWGGDSSKSR